MAKIFIAFLPTVDSTANGGWLVDANQDSLVDKVSVSRECDDAK
jgi:hypothetical protein